LRMKEKRLEEITKFLGSNGSAEVSQLSALLKVTEKTIRQDLVALEEKGILERVHGGAKIKNNINDIYPFPKRRRDQNLQSKRSIAKAALSFIEDGDILILDSGSTTLELAKILDKKVSVITNDPIISYTLISRDNVLLFCTGGELRREGGLAYTGTSVIKALDKHHATKCFLAATAFDIKHGAMVFSSQEGEIKRAYIEASDKVFLMIDHSKFNQSALYTYASTSDIQDIITDTQISRKDIEELQARHINVHIAEQI
jgi:DeoR family fructose operon transcriptional repressor